MPHRPCFVEWGPEESIQHEETGTVSDSDVEGDRLAELAIFLPIFHSILIDPAKLL